MAAAGLGRDASARARRGRGAEFHRRAAPEDLAWLKNMTANDSFPLGHPAFISHTLDRAAHLRSNDEKLLALENHRDARAYVVHRDSLVAKRDANGSRSLLTIDEVLKFGANPSTIFPILRNDAPLSSALISTPPP